MKQTVLGAPPGEYQKQIRRHRASLFVCGAVAVCLNVLFTALRTDENHIWMLLANILTSIAGGWFLLAQWSLVTAPMVRLYGLTCRPSEQVQVQILRIDRTPVRVEHFDCCKLYTQDRVFLLLENTLSLEAGDTAVLTVASGIITEAEVL